MYMLNVIPLSLWNMRSMFRNGNRSEERGVKAAHSKVWRWSECIYGGKVVYNTPENKSFLSQGAVATCHLTLLNIIQEMSAVITARRADEG